MGQIKLHNIINTSILASIYPPAKSRNTKLDKYDAKNALIKLKMKKLIYTIMALISVSVLFQSCQNDELLDVPTDETMVKNATQQTSDCIKPEGPYCEMADLSDLQFWSVDDNEKTKQISYVAYNTDSKFIVKVGAYGNFDADATYTVTVNFGSADIVLINDLKGAGLVEPFEFELPAGWKGEDVVKLKVYQEGDNNPVTFTATYRLVGICND